VEAPQGTFASSSCGPAKPLNEDNEVTHQQEIKDLPLRDDIRLLGRLLGDTVREQEGDDVFSVVEKIRQTSIRFDRDADAAAGAKLQAILDSQVQKLL
jgi:phosphoenolpyruvate carboxylase